MVLFKYPVFVHLGRKLILEHGLKSEVIFRQCSSRVLPVEKQIIYKQSQSVSALNNEEEKPVLRIISKPRVVNRVALIPKHETEKEDDEFDSLFEIHREDFDSDESLHGFTPKLPKALDPSTEDLSDLGTNPVPSFNIASFADKNPTIQEFVKLGVELWKVEKKAEIAKKLVSLDFEKDVKPYIQFLHDSGVPANELGAFITKNPFIFNVDLDDLRTRIRYLRAHQFHPRMISTILTKNPQWISYNTKSIDTRLGYFQNNFKLNGPEVRLVAVKLPKLITYSMMAIENKSLAIQKEMGFQLSLRKKMLMKSPRLWTKCRKNLVEAFDYAHNTMHLTHEIIAEQPQILHCRKSRLENRHKFLMELKKAQYDPLKPMYISPKTLVTGTDAEFCKNAADTSVLTYNLFLKSL